MECVLDMTYLVDQPVSAWIRAVEEKFGKPEAERCFATVLQLGGTSDTMVYDLRKDPLTIINEALEPRR